MNENRAFIYTVIIIYFILVSAMMNEYMKINKELDVITHIITIPHQQIVRHTKAINDADKEIMRYNRVQILTVKVTAYAPLDNTSGICNDGDGTKTSTGSYPSFGTVAVDPQEVKYGTVLFIPGYGYGKAQDTGGALRGYSEGMAVDVYMDTYAEAMDWGVKYIEVIIFDGRK